MDWATGNWLPAGQPETEYVRYFGWLRWPLPFGSTVQKIYQGVLGLDDVGKSDVRLPV
jgi:hypothetical protein